MQFQKNFDILTRTVQNVKMNGVERKKREERIDRKYVIDKNTGRMIKKIMKGKKGIGKRTVARITEKKRSTIRAFLKKQDWGIYQRPKKLGLAKKNLEYR